MAVLQQHLLGAGAALGERRLQALRDGGAQFALAPGDTRRASRARSAATASVSMSAACAVRDRRARAWGNRDSRALPRCHAIRRDANARRRSRGSDRKPHRGE